MASYPRILAAIPCYHSVEPTPLVNFLIMSQHSGRMEAEGRYAVRWAIAGPKVKTHIARNTNCQIARDGGASHLCFIDDDMVVPKDAIDRLLAHDVDIVAPLFFRSTHPFDPLVFRRGDDGYPVPWEGFPRMALFEPPAGVGTGMMLIKTSVLRGMEEPYFRQPHDDRLTMDLDFCRRAQEAGFRVWCDSTLIIDQMGMKKPTGFEDWEATRQLTQAV